MAKTGTVLALLLIGALIIGAVMFSGRFAATSSNCPDVALTDDNGNALTSYQQFRDLSGQQQFTDEQLSDAGLAIKDGVLVQTGQCPEVLVTQ